MPAFSVSGLYKVVFSWFVVQQTNKYITMVLLLLCGLLVTLSADAHIKWFAPYDVMATPKALMDIVVSPSFYSIGIMSIAVVFIASLVDRHFTKITLFLDNFRCLLTRNFSQHYEFDVLRYTLAIFFTSIWTLGGVILTPELKHDSLVVSTIQLIILVSLFFKRTAFVAGIGIIVLWLYSVYYYGFFHVADYVSFLGVAAFIILASRYPTKYVGASYVILYAAISLPLQWVSVEKFAYAHWSYPVLESYPHLTMGLSKEIFMDLAGFAEFTMAFLLISMSGFCFTAVTLFLGSIFIAAIYDFGKVDAIGHLISIVALFVMAMHGPTRLNLWFSSLHRQPIINALYISLIYIASLIFFFGVYYLVRHLWLLTVSY